jgi:uncharacterized protein YyaL (SSP411 family)
MTAVKNELSRSHNPYLLQHKDNPVSWHLWGDGAFEEARFRNVPVLVSIGYSTCHWCHVMAHEVFEHEETAAIMNENFVCIKVDREEHPEVDEVYMEACQAMNGSGGWPLNVFVGHDGKPFFAVTYLPRERWGNLVLQIVEAWRTNQDEILGFADQLAGSLQQGNVRDHDSSEDIKGQLFAFLTEHYDDAHPDFSGAGRSPRFPSHTLYYFLLSQRNVPDEIASRLESVLEAIQDSGLHDRVGGGFHRYSTDREWRVPHFEKMLYDNAQFMSVFAMASSRFNRPDFLQTSEHIADYLCRDMALYENKHFLGFASAEDADDPNGEGSFYAWTSEQLIEILGESLGRGLALEWNLVSDNSGIHGVYPHKIPHPRGSVSFQGLSAREKMERRREWVSYCHSLLEKRQHRARPFRDEKVVTETNALALLGFTILYAHTLKPGYLSMIDDLVKILLERYNGGVLQRIPGKNGHLTDYGHSALAMFTAWEATANEDYLKAAINIIKSAFEKFVTSTGKIFTSDAESRVFMRFEEKYDHAQPAGAHSLLLAWVRIQALGKLTEFEPLVNVIFENKRQIAYQIPAMTGSLVQAIDEFENGPITLTFHHQFREHDRNLAKWTGTQVRLIPDDHHEVLQFCEKDRCLLPVKTPEELQLSFAW